MHPWRSQGSIHQRWFYINFPVRLPCSLRLFFFSRAEFSKVASVFPASTISAALENLSTAAVGKQKRYPLSALAT